MVSKGQIQLARSLDRKKERDETGLFIAEGDKIVSELLHLPSGNGFRVKLLFATEGWFKSQGTHLTNPPEDSIEVSSEELAKLSLLKTPNQAVAIVHKPSQTSPAFDYSQDLLLGLDQIQDPGNVGTLIRLADWFGLAGIVASLDTADPFSPKVVQASMGSVFRIPFIQIPIDSFLVGLPKEFPCYATSLDGDPVYQVSLTKNGIILLGNESHGLKTRFKNFATRNLLIPSYNQNIEKAESLNVSIAAAIICSEFRRR
jgi:TrmH family RNA methyltransferase